MTKTPQFRTLPLALAAACLLAACSKSPQEMGCDDTQVQTDARKLLAVKLQKWQEPISPVSWAQDHMRQQSPELAATLNGLKARSARIDQITLADVKQLSQPQTPLLDADPADEGLRLPEALRPKRTGNKLLYQCAATAHLPLPAAKVAKVPEANQALIGIEKDTLKVVVHYQTELTPEGNMWVAVALANPLAEIALRAMLAEPQPETQTAQE